MANARKCDRCGRFFDPFEFEGSCCKFRNPVFQTAKDIREGRIGTLMNSKSPDIFIDLCPDCAERFDRFMCGVDPEDYAMMGQLNYEKYFPVQNEPERMGKHEQKE